MSYFFSALKKTINRILLFCFVVLTFNSCEKKEDVLPEVFGSVAGSVYNEFDQRLDGVTITVTGNGVNRKVSTINGFYEINYLSVGRYELSLSQPNYIGLSTVVNIKDEQRVTENFQLKSGEVYLNVSDTLFNAGSNQGLHNISIKSNSSWTVNTDADWLKTSHVTGSGNGEVLVSWTKNDSPEVRVGLVKVSAGNIQKQFMVSQAAKLMVVAQFGLPGNGARSEVDSVYIRFNRKVKINNIRPHLETCITSINTTYTDNNFGIKFNYGCAKLGGEYTFDIEVEDEDEQKTSYVLKIPFYSRKVEVPGRIVKHFVDESNKTYWVLTASPNAIYELAMSDLAVKNKFVISFEPRGLAINYLTNELYIYQDSPVLSVLNRTSGILKREITIPGSQNDHPSHPTIYPYDLEFTGNGLGILLLNAKGSSAISWRMFDSKKNDSFFNQEQHDQIGIQSFPYFTFAHVNYDKSKLLLMPSYGSAQIAIFDQNTQKITSYLPPDYTRGIFITPNRKDDRVYMGQLYNQLIVNPFTGFVSNQSYLDNRENGSADFSYKANESNVIYFCDNKYLQVLNYDQSKTHSWYDVMYGLRGATSTTDGKYLLAYNADVWYYSGRNSYVVQFSTDIL